MKKNITISNTRCRLLVGAVLLVIAVACDNSFAFERYKNPSTGTGNCSDCHGAFTGATSPKGTVFPSGSKHEMHRSSSDMNTTCNLCHTSGDTRNPFIGSSTGTANNVGLGCAGCHVGAGLRAHHEANGVTICLDCHNPETSPPENVKPPYYGTPDTRADNPCNGVALAKTNENWSVGDFEGLDNDGNNLYDMADSACGSSGMAVLPEGGLSSSGTVGGPFSPSSIIYTLTNAGGSSFNWTASKAQNWVSFSATNGTLAAGASTNVTVSLNTNATSLTPGNYSDTVTLVNTTTGSGDTSRSVSLTVNSPGVLSVSPVGSLSSSGTVGGPFNPSTIIYALTNSGGSTLNWTASQSQNWVSLSAASGSLAPGSATTVAVSINASATSLTPGSYSDTVGFTNTTAGNGNTSRTVSLTVNSVGVLAVSPAGSSSSSGHLGGPFAPSNHVYTLTNSGGTALDWVASTPAPWLGLSPSNGTLAPFAAATVVAAFNTNAQILPSGSNYAAISFSTPGGGTSPLVRELALSIYPLPVWTAEVQASNTTFQAQMEAVPNWTYFIEVTTNLIDWTRMATNQADGDGVLIFIDSGAALVPRRFFRAVAAP